MVLLSDVFNIEITALDKPTNNNNNYLEIASIMITSCAAVFLTHQIRDCEQLAINTHAISEQELMHRAGTAAFIQLQKQFPSAKKILIYAGSGNNAGDGYVLALLAWKAGFSVLVNQYKLPEQLPPSAQQAAFDAIDAGVLCQFMDEALDFEADLIVDALLGTGLTGMVNDVFASAINQINESGVPVLSIDIPSGLQADTGKVMGCCVKASLTMTFIAPKLGMMTLDGTDQCGDIVCDDLDIGFCLANVSPAAQIVQGKLPLTKRLRNSHKGSFGHVLMIGGNQGMPGSIAMAAKAALRTGAGLVTAATSSLYASTVLHDLPEALIYGIDIPEDILPLLAKATVCVIGPGLGEDDWARQLFAYALSSQLPMVIDASALRLLASHPQHDDNWVLTPHPGEAADLLGVSSADIQNDRLQSIIALQQQYGGNIVLKGSGSLIQTDDQLTWLCRAGNPGMASAGMGDVLSGIIGGLIAQGLALNKAARWGVWLHARAGDLAALENGERGMLASDLLPFVQYLVNQNASAQ